MLNYSDIAKLIKPCMALHACKIVLFGSLSILFIASGQVSFSSINDSVSQCSPYLNMKLSLYIKQIQLITFFMTVLGCIINIINFVTFLNVYIKARKKLTSTLKENQGYTQNRLKFNFIAAFLQTICLINIFIRFVQQLRQFQNCNFFSKTVTIVSIILLSLLIFISLGNYWILVKLLLLINKKLETLQQFSFYSDRTSIRENLIYNKIGYVINLLKKQNFSSRSTSLKSQTIKGIPSGYKRNDFSSTRQIIYKLLGGNKQQLSETQNNQPENQRKISYQEQFNIDIELSSQRKKSNDQKKKQIESQQNNISLLDVKPKFYMPGPNQESLKQATKTIDILQVTLGKKQPPKLQYESSVSEQQGKNKLNSPLQNQGLFKANTTQKFKNDPNQKEKQKISKELRQQEELKQKFNLTPNIQERRKYEKTKNWQNIDENGNYYQVNLQKIKTKTKLLKFVKLKEDNEQINPNVLYSKGQWVQRKKRVAKKHEKNVQEYLRNLSRIRKQEMLCQEDSSDYSQSFQEDDLSSQVEDQSNEYEEQDCNHQNEQKQQQNQGTQKKVDNETKENNDDQNIQKPIKRKKKLKNTQPQLYLHMRRRKHAPVENKLKLFEDEQGFYDDENDLQSSEGDYKMRNEEEIQIEKIYEKGLGRDQSLQKQRQQQKIHFKNKQLETQEADMLKFIRKKYIETKHNKTDRSKIDKKAIIFEQQRQNSQTKQRR